MIKYTATFKGFKIKEEYIVEIDLGVMNPIYHKYFSYVNRVLTIKKGYWWNGVTCWFTTKSTLKGTLIHDVFYQMMELRLLPLHYKGRIDNYYEWMIIKDGAWEWYAKLSRWVLSKQTIKT